MAPDGLFVVAEDINMSAGILGLLRRVEEWGVVEICWNSQYVWQLTSLNQRTVFFTAYLTGVDLYDYDGSQMSARMR